MDSEKRAMLVANLLALPRETSWVEDKHNYADPEGIGSYLSCLANSAALEQQEHGYLIWGVEDGTRNIVGTTIDPLGMKKGNEDLTNWLTRLLSPETHFTFHEVWIDGKRLVLMTVDPAAYRPVAFSGVEYIRVGSHKKQLKAHPDYVKRLWQALDATPFEAGVAAEGITDTEALALIDYPSYFQLLGLPLPDHRAGIMDALSAESLIVRRQDGSWNVTNLGAILFARKLESFPHLKRKAVRVIQYDGANRVSTVREQVGEYGYANGFSGLIDFIEGLLPSNEKIEKALREVVPLYPPLAVRELVANAIIHQDFSLTGTGPTIEIFDGRVEITNPGRPLIEPSRFVDNPPRSRNEQLASLARRAGICEERGSGWDKIGIQVELNHLPAPLVDVSADHTKVTLFGPRDLNQMDRTERIRATYLHACLKYVSGERVTNSSIRGRFGIHVRNSARASQVLKEAVTEGQIVPRDPQASYKLMEYVPWWAGADPVPPANLI